MPIGAPSLRAGTDACPEVKERCFQPPGTSLHRQLSRLHVRGQQSGKTLGIAAPCRTRWPHTVDPGMAPGDGETSRIAGHVIVMSQAEIKLRVQLQPVEHGENGVVGARFLAPASGRTGSAAARRPRPHWPERTARGAGQTNVFSAASSAEGWY